MVYPDFSLVRFCIGCETKWWLDTADCTEELKLKRILASHPNFVKFRFGGSFSTGILLCGNLKMCIGSYDKLLS